MATRDYKHVRRGGGSSFDIRQYKQFGVGLGAGLVVALLVWVQAQRGQVNSAVEAEPEPVEVEAPPVAEADPAEQYDFYDMLPKFEVVVPEAEKNPRRDQPTVKLSKPGAYVLQAGSYRNKADAERLRDRLRKQGIETSIQHVTIDEKEWHRVRVGPSRDLARVNALREQLRAADVSFIVYEVGE